MIVWNTVCSCSNKHATLKHDSFITHRRSVAKRGGCFQWCLFVCLFVRTIISERLNVRWSNLAVRCTIQKSCPSSKVEVKGQGPQTKNKKTAESSLLTMYRRTCTIAMPYSASRNTRHHCVAAPGVTGYASGKISACCPVTITVFISTFHRYDLLRNQ